MTFQAQLLAVARGDKPADLLITGGRVVNVFSGEIEAVDVAVVGGRVAGLGAGYEAKEIVEVGGAYVVPGLIDAHVHVESSMCLLPEFARAIVPRGITGVVIDPHEIANVLGAAGVEMMARSAEGVPLEVVVMAPSCVPATGMAGGATPLHPTDIAALRAAGTVHGLAEVMNFPGVIGNSVDIRAKLDAMRGTPIDGHCPGARGKALNAYVAAGVGSDHESVTIEEAREKLARGLYLLIREATNARNLDALLPLITPRNCRRICFCSDDRTAGDLLSAGSIDDMVRRAMAFGIEPVEAIRMATLNTAEWFDLPHLGAIAPGRVANFSIVPDLFAFAPTAVFVRGKKVAEGGVMREARVAAGRVLPTQVVKIDWAKIELSVPATGSQVRVIGSRADQLVTDHLELPAMVLGGLAVADVAKDVLKMAVIDRHTASGRHAVAFIRGFGLKSGAIAGTVAHDHHNLVLIGASDAAMLAAGKAAMDLGGGLAVADDSGRVLASLALPVAGLMSDAPVEEVAAGYARLLAAARGLGSGLSDPFMAMSFMALEVIPSLKLTEQGLVDVEKFAVVDLFV